MKRHSAFLLLCLFVIFSITTSVFDGPISVYSSLHGGCTESIVKEIGQAKKSDLVQAYSFTSAQIAKALTDAYKRGVKVEAILDNLGKSH